ncbi:hypothetical protein AYO20_08892 [Fonsecaea nubica]|uniref:C2 NT-type domain-containing protein n=1 Tax=Fonsecaea nubica TaxID=856822 RepID=A0A178CJE7_9EURO|nr:hypothetical protein AYO20_08892 [Fonsecaea nubica]OAL30089.1 hypothetical protein AYO20_08892 [Fonsecaea nubica]
MLRKQALINLAFSVPKNRKPKFDLILRIIDLTNIPLIYGTACVRWHLSSSNAAEHRGRTDKAPIEEHKATWDYWKEIPVRLTIDKTGMLQECDIHFEVLQEFHEGGRGGRVHLGNVKLNLAEYTRLPDLPPADRDPQDEADDGSITRRYLLQDSKVNSTLKIGIRMRQTEGDSNFIAPPLRSAMVVGGIAGVLTTEAGEGDDIPSITSKTRELSEAQDIYRRTLAATWACQSGELPPDKLVENLFAGGDGGVRPQSSSSKASNQQQQQREQQQQHPQNTRLGLREENGSSSSDEPRRPVTPRQFLTPQVFASGISQGQGHRRGSSRDSPTLQTTAAGAVSGRASIEQQVHASQQEHRRRDRSEYHEFTEFDLRDDLRSWEIGGVAAHQLPHEEVDEDHTHPPPPHPGSDLKSQPTTPPRPNFRRHNFRKWKPKPTAQLGVNSLGTPAEVLLLPTRDRRIPEVPKDEGTGKMLGSTLEESINSESAPLSGPKLAENIEHVRSLVGKMRGQLEKHEWTTLKRQLHTGFQKQQLTKYIRLRKGNLSVTDDLEKYNKREIIKYLVEEVWGFTTPVQDEPVSTGKQSKMVITLHEPVKFDHLLMHPSQPLKKIAEELDVQLDVYPSQYKIRATGSRSNAQQALQRISRYVKNLGQIVIPLHDTHRDMYQDPATREYLTAYLKSIQRKYPGLNIGMDEQYIRIVHLGNQRGADQARREILLSVPTGTTSGESVIWPRKVTSAIAYQPFPTPSEFPALLHHAQWLRLVSISPSPPTGNAGSRKEAALTPILQGLWGTSDPFAKVGSEGNRQELYHDVTAKFGQALTKEVLQAANGGAAQHVAVDSQKQGRYFVGGGPFLPQHLALMEPWIDPPSNPANDIDQHARAILRLELSPVLTSTDLPTFEIIVTAGEAVGGQRPRLKVVRVSAIHQEKHLTVLCPHTRMDVRLTQQLKQDLAYPGSSETDVVQAFMNALRVYIGNAQGHGSSDWVFRPFVTLQVPLGLQEARKHPQQAALLDARQETRSGGKTKGAKSPAGTIEKKQEYILRSVDVVDVDSRLFSVESASQIPKTKTNPKPTSKRTSMSTARFCLDHVTYTGAAGTRQELRLAERPLLSPPTFAQPDLPVFVKAALDLVKRLDNDPMKAIPAKTTS